MRHSNSITCVVVTAISGIMFADTLLVPTEYETIQSAIDAAALKGDTVQVDVGIYNETIDFLGKAITVESTAGEPSGTYIDGAGLSGSVVSFITQETEASVLDGFTIRNGSAVDGGGVHIVGSAPSIQNCVISGNTSSRFGGGLYAESSTLSLENVSITLNASGNTGAGIYTKYSEGSITGCSFENNNGTSGAGIYVKEGSGVLTFTNVSMNGNKGSKHGGAIFNNGSVLIVLSCDFESNEAGQHGGVFYSIYDGDSTFSDCQFLNNSAVIDGGVANIRPGNAASFSLCTFSGNIADSDCDGIGQSGVMEISSNSVTLENPTICSNLICDYVEDFSGNQPTIVGDILGCSTEDGACCGGTACWEMSETDCLDGDGVWSGEDTLCAMVTCFTPDADDGGCCIDDICIMAASMVSCEEVGGTFEGELVECEDVVCVGCPADINGDGYVEVNDIIEVIQSWGVCP